MAKLKYIALFFEKSGEFFALVFEKFKEYFWTKKYFINLLFILFLSILLAACRRERKNRRSQKEMCLKS
jgi:hypothetical protein